MAKSIITGAALCLSLSAANASTINYPGTGDASAFAHGRWTVADDFSLTEDSALESLTVYGVYRTSTPGATADFSIGFQSDPLTLDPTLNSSIFTGTVFDTGNTATVSAFGTGPYTLYGITFDLSGIELSAGDYWVTYHAEAPDAFHTEWGTGGNNVMSQWDTNLGIWSNFSDVTGSAALNLEFSQSVSLPPSAVLMLLPLLGLLGNAARSSRAKS